MSKVFNVSFHQEICCDECGDIIHFHFEDKCPVCNTPKAGTDRYCSVYDVFTDDGLFKCNVCNAEFKILKYDYYSEPEAIIEYLLFPTHQLIN